MSDSTHAQTEFHAADDLRKLLHEAEQALGHSAGDAGDKFDELRRRLRTALDRSKDSLERLRAEATRRARQADQLVRDHPYQAIGIAAGVGALIGLLVARSNHGSRQ